VAYFELGWDFFLLTISVRPTLLHRGSFPRVKQLGCEAGHPVPSSAKVKNVWSYSSTPH
jgi:hypothetical protein